VASPGIFTREVENSKFAMQFDGESVARARGCSRSRKAASKMNDVILCNSRHPRIRRLRKANPAKSGCVIVLNQSSIGALIRLVSAAKCRSSVVQGVALAMVDMRGPNPKNLLLHWDHAINLPFLFVSLPGSVESAIGLYGKPEMLHQRIVIGFPYERVKPLRKRNFPAPLSFDNEDSFNDRGAVFESSTRLTQRERPSFLFSAFRANIVRKLTSVGVRKDNSSCHWMTLIGWDVFTALRQDSTSLVNTNVSPEVK